MAKKKLMCLLMLVLSVSCVSSENKQDPDLSRYSLCCQNAMVLTQVDILVNKYIVNSLNDYANSISGTAESDVNGIGIGETIQNLTMEYRVIDSDGIRFLAFNTEYGDFELDPNHRYLKGKLLCEIGNSYRDQFYQGYFKGTEIFLHLITSSGTRGIDYEFRFSSRLGESFNICLSESESK